MAHTFSSGLLTLKKAIQKKARYALWDNANYMQNAHVTMRIVSELMSREIYQAQRGAPEALPAEVRVISRQTETCGRGRGSSRPNFLHPRTAAHRKSEPTHTQAHRSKRAHTCKRKKFLVATLGADPGDRPPATAAFSVQ